MLNYLISAFIFSSVALSTPDQDGWVTLERPEALHHGQGADERDPSIWVVFSKRVGLEKFLIKFPDQPTYQYMDAQGDRIEVVSRSESAEHRLQVFEEIFTSSHELLASRKQQLEDALIVAESEHALERWSDLTYLKQGHWFQERLIATDHHTYFLQTKTADLESEVHQMFVHSFDLDHHFRTS